MSDLRKFDKGWLDKRGNFYALITPDVAAELLTRNTKNRSKKPLKIAQYAHDMANGRWNADSSDIKFDRDGVLIDGQNRLMACIEADVPFPTLVRTGLDPQSFAHVDTGGLRTTGDVFKIAGVTDYFNVAAAVSLRARYESIVEAGQTIIEKRLPLTRQDALDYLTAHPAMEKMHTLARQLYITAPGIQRGVWLSGLSMAAEKDEELARKVASQFIGGDVSSGPMVALMRYAMATQTPKQQERSVKLKNAGLRHLTAFVQAWNALRRDEPLQRITIRDDEKPEAAV